MTDLEIKRNLRAVANVIASQRLEGLEVDSKTKEALEQTARGEMSIEQLLQSAKARIAAGEFKTPKAQNEETI